MFFSGGARCWKTFLFKLWLVSDISESAAQVNGRIWNQPESLRRIIRLSELVVTAFQKQPRDRCSLTIERSGEVHKPSSDIR